MKKIAIVLVIMVIGFGLWKAVQTKPEPGIPQAVVTDVSPAATDTTMSGTTASPTTTISGKQIDNAKVTVGFTGFGPGKKHVGTFTAVDSKLRLSATGDVAGTLSLKVDSLKTDDAKLDTHLKTDDFFDVAKYPTATFTVTEDLTASTCKGDNVRCKAPYLYGTFTIHGVTKALSFPVVRGADNYTANFTLNLKEFGIDQAFANEVVQLSIVAPVK